ncbi:hypothetical protein ACIA3K_27900 [Micromonospora sp. NPDC051543]|uniref:hypothetical protein n=1 Tax=Micromonospora sp. NPDC051543 TaxID=3364287 RepID=UPI00378B9EC1
MSLAYPQLVRRPYDLRRAAALLWMDAATEVARRLGHGVANGGDDTRNDEIGDAVG